MIAGCSSATSAIDGANVPFADTSLDVWLLSGMTPASLHFLVGSTGAGKTTYAIRFCVEFGAVRFSIDEWMSALFWMDSPQPIEPAWSMERVERCSKQIWDTALQIAKLGTPCMLEAGFATRSRRLKYAALAIEAGLSVQIHLLDPPVEERWRRVQRRNERSVGREQLVFAVTRDMFDYTETFWEPPTDEEMAQFAGVRVNA
jgi:predicted kinase